jgi:hypothetical protein
VVRYVRDSIHGFSRRPHYDAAELDSLFEREVVGFLKSKYGEARFPITTEDLKTMIERDVSDLEQYADLSRFGEGVEGVTVFAENGKPKVLVAAELTEDDRRSNRLRTTLTHEYGHVKLHAYMFAAEQPRHSLLLPGQQPNAIYCKRETMMPANKTDWREWQAGYACGATLMPASFVRRTVASIQQRFGIYGSVPADSPAGTAMITAVVERYEVSREAARVRLSVLNLLGRAPAQRSLFS